jgi:hypothetical protein
MLAKTGMRFYAFSRHCRDHNLMPTPDRFAYFQSSRKVTKQVIDLDQELKPLSRDQIDAHLLHSADIQRKFLERKRHERQEGFNMSDKQGRGSADT